MSELKSIILSSACTLISLLFLITTITAVVAINDESFRKQIINDLPTKTDIDYYLAGLEKVVDFCLQHRIYVDSNMEFGLFMVDVHLKELVKQKRINFSKNTRSHMENVLLKSNALINYFHKMVRKHEDVKELEEEIKLTRLFYNKTTWSPSDKFNLELLKQTKVYSPEMLEKMYGKWNTYVIFVLDEGKHVPSPADWDICTAHLAMNPRVQNSSFQGICQIPNDCQESLDTGNDYGYGLLHRTLLMIVARFSRDCVVVSRKADKFKTDRYCMMSFNEAEYIASNNFELPDLMFEQIGLCGILGHAQFLRNYWLKSLLLYQTQEGCFTQKLATGDLNKNLLREEKDDTWSLSKSSIMNGQCDGHFTAVAMVALSNALRYIIETYY